MAAVWYGVLGSSKLLIVELMTGPARNADKLLPSIALDRGKSRFLFEKLADFPYAYQDRHAMPIMFKLFWTPKNNLLKRTFGAVVSKEYACFANDRYYIASVT
jgi:hypothetical protein